MATLFAKKRSTSGRKRPRTSEDGDVVGAHRAMSKKSTIGATDGRLGDVGAEAAAPDPAVASGTAQSVSPEIDSKDGDGVQHPSGGSTGDDDGDGVSAEEATFESLGLCDWLLTACKAMGFRRPTPVQRHCIPAVLQGKDVLGCAETGSGKTAAFALPILHELSKDPYGVFAVVLTPTRELAVQISEQFGALGALMGLRHTVVIGGVGLLEQSLELAGRPHVVVATPGRLRDHLQGPAAPALRKCRYLVLDEADRLLAPTFQGELRCIAEALPRCRQTLLFSATMTSNLEALESLALTNPVKHDLTMKAVVPATLTQHYLFMPQQMKTCFVVQTLHKLASDNLWSDPEERYNRKRGGKGGGKDYLDGNGQGGGQQQQQQEEEQGERARSVIIFVSKCRRCQELSETLLELGVDCTPLHSLLGQRRRMAALGKFKSQQTKVLVSTDVASRGLDIPAVDLVINFDVPKVATDYVHRVGRTARAGRRGRAVSLVSQYDIELVHNIEEYTGTPLGLCPEVKEDDVLKLLNLVAKASRVAKMRLMEQGFDERESFIKERNIRQRDRKLGGHNAKVGGIRTANAQAKSDAGSGAASKKKGKGGGKGKQPKSSRQKSGSSENG